MCKEKKNRLSLTGLSVCVWASIRRQKQKAKREPKTKKMAAVTLVLNELQSDVTSANLTVPAGSNSPGVFYSVGLVRPCGSRYPPATNPVRRRYFPCGQTLPSAVTSNPLSTVLNNPKSTVAFSFCSACPWYLPTLLSDT